MGLSPTDLSPFCIVQFGHTHTHTPPPITTLSHSKQWVSEWLTCVHIVSGPDMVPALSLPPCVCVPGNTGCWRPTSTHWCSEGQGSCSPSPCVQRVWEGAGSVAGGRCAAGQRALLESCERSQGNMPTAQSNQTAGLCWLQLGMAQPVQEVCSKALEVIFNTNTSHFYFCFSEKLRFPYIQANRTLLYTVIVAYAAGINAVKIKPRDLIPYRPFHH